MSSQKGVNVNKQIIIEPDFPFDVIHIVNTMPTATADSVHIGEVFICAWIKFAVNNFPKIHSYLMIFRKYHIASDTNLICITVVYHRMKRFSMIFGLPLEQVGGSTVCLQS